MKTDKMMNIQKKSLQHASNILTSFDTYQIYNELNNAMTEADIEPEAKKKILKRLSSAVGEQHNKITDAKSWIEAVLSDLPN